VLKARPKYVKIPKRWQLSCKSLDHPTFLCISFHTMEIAISVTLKIKLLASSWVGRVESGHYGSRNVTTCFFVLIPQCLKSVLFTPLAYFLWYNLWYTFGQGPLREQEIKQISRRFIWGVISWYSFLRLGSIIPSVSISHSLQ